MKLLRVLRMLLIGLLGLCLVPSVVAADAAPTAATAASPVAVPPPPTIGDLVLLLKSYTPDLERTRKLRAAMDLPLPDTTDAAALAFAWHQRAMAAEELGETERWMAALGKGLEYARTLPPSTASDVGTLLRLRLDHALALRSARGLVASLEAYEALLAEYKEQPAPWMIPSSFQVATGHIALGDLERAKVVIDRTEVLARMLGRRPRLSMLTASWAQFIERARGMWLRRQGKLADEERSFLAAVRQGETEVRNSETRRADGGGKQLVDRSKNQLVISRMLLAGTYIFQQRLDEAELLLREVLKDSLQRNGRNSRVTGNVLKTLSLVYTNRGRYQEAAVIAEWAETALAEAGLAPVSPERLHARIVLANSLVVLGRNAEAVTLFDAVRANVADDSRLEEGYTVATLNSVRAYIAVGRFKDAERDADTRLTEHSRNYGADHYYTAEVRAYRAMVLHRTERVDEARREFERAVAVLIDPAKAVGTQQTSAARVNRLRLVLNEYLGVLVGAKGARSEADMAEAFRIADVARWQSVQKAVTGSAVRAAAGSPQLGALIKKVQDADDELQAVYTNLIALRSAPPDRQLPVVIAAMEARITALRSAQQTDLTEIRRQFPQYDDLVNPRPADQARVRKALRANEALLSIYVTAGGSYVWAMNAEGALHFHFSPQPSSWVQQLVKRLRDSVDLTVIDAPEKMRFDMAAGEALYQEFLAPVAAAWQGSADKPIDTLLVVANEALGQIPFSLLPTAVAPAGSDGKLPLSRFRQTPWLARQLAVAYLPSVSTLVTLRALPAASAGREAFIGFGDPDFGASAAPASGTSRSVSRGIGKSVRKLRSGERPAWDEKNPNAAIPATTLSPLPDTRDEITAIARALHADPLRDAFFGAQANVRNVMGADLKHRRIVAFATHGLVAGDLPGLDQPALALAPPSGGGVSEGLLRLDHILKLSLDADLVVLSACNTAAADGSGAEAVSGLGRGFFYAGSRAVLATHWPVETVSARHLMVRLFEGYAGEGVGGKPLTRAQALRHAMLDLIDKEVASDVRGKPVLAYAHPAFWAPYALYGDPGR